MLHFYAKFHETCFHVLERSKDIFVAINKKSLFEGGVKSCPLGVPFACKATCAFGFVENDTCLSIPVFKIVATP
jgi:hypothetical protein